MPIPENARCLVVGASGFIGRVLCKQLQTMGHPVRALLRTPVAGPWHDSCIGDIASTDKLTTDLFRDIDTVFYLASIAHGKASSDQYEKINVTACIEFAKLAIRNNVKRFIYVSSTKAMTDDKYGLSKRRAEEGLLALDGFEHLVIIRPCLVYGPGVQGNLHAMIRMIDHGLFPPLPDTGSTRSMISVFDLSAALIAVAYNQRANRKIYIVSDGQSYSVKEIEKSMRKALGKKIPEWSLPAWLFLSVGRIGDYVRVVFKSFPLDSAAVDKLLGSALYSSEQIQRDIDWRPMRTFADDLPGMISTYKSQSG